MSIIYRIYYVYHITFLSCIITIFIYSYYNQWFCFLCTCTGAPININTVFWRFFFLIRKYNIIWLICWTNTLRLINFVKITNYSNGLWIYYTLAHCKCRRKLSWCLASTSLLSKIQISSTVLLLFFNPWRFRKNSIIIIQFAASSKTEHLVSSTIYSPLQHPHSFNNPAE